MSQENVEAVRAGYDAWNAGDLQALRELYDPDAVMYHLEGWPEPVPPWDGRPSFASLRRFGRHGKRAIR